MLRKRQNLIFPERRQRTRIITLRNFGYGTLAFAAIFTAITIRSELRGRDTRNYGRLLSSQIAAPVPQKPLEVVREEPAAVDDQTAADPTLIAPMVREQQWLEPEPVATQIVPPTAARGAGTGEKVTVVGGPDGVTVVREERRKPVLSGGFGRR